MSSLKENVKNLIRKFHQVQSKWIHQGACDTEPNAVFRHIIQRAKEGKPFLVNTVVRDCTFGFDGSADGWELYSFRDEPEKAELSKQAAIEMTSAAKEVYDAVFEIAEAYRICSFI